MGFLIRISCFLIIFNANAANLINSIVSAPVVSNGLLAEAPTELNIFLNIPKAPNQKLAFDPIYFGHQIPAGGKMVLHLGGSFERNGVDNNRPFVRVKNNLNLVLVIGHPQNPIVAGAGEGVQHGNYKILDDGNKNLIIVPNSGHNTQGLQNSRADKIGFKVLHLRPNPKSKEGPGVFTNGPAGSTGSISLTIYDRENKIIKEGFKKIIFPKSIGRQIHITNAGLTTAKQGSPKTDTAELVESTNFQHVSPETQLINTKKVTPFSLGAPYAPRFLLFDSAQNQPDPFVPQKGIKDVSIELAFENNRVGDLVVNYPDGHTQKIGSIKMTGPSKDSTFKLLPSDQRTISGNGITGANGSVLSVPVQVGKTPGVYHVRISLLKGAEATNTILVE